jgi:high-affinity K+ transport system ATPase subunit B
VTDDERREISEKAKAEAGIDHRLAALEKAVGGIQTVMTWGVRTIWAAAVYLAAQLWDFIASGGAIK